jgi:glycosyltransferase involved in cell wall biosynthesis
MGHAVYWEAYENAVAIIGNANAASYLYPMSRIFIDVTQLVHWTGKITGIPRVMDELAARFVREESDDIVFVSWVSDLGDFCEIDFPATMLGGGIVYLKPGVSSSAATPSAPASISTHRKITLKRVAKYGIRKTARFSKRLSAKIERRAKQLAMAGYKRAAFASGDRLFVMWGEWWDPMFTERLVQAHKQQGVRLVQVIHDIATTVWPQYYEKVDVDPTTYNAAVLPIADLVLCVSKNTKKELVEWLRSQNLHVPRVEVFRLGDVLEAAAPAMPNDPAFVSSKLKGSDYIMCVGTIEAKKNHALFYYVYKWAKLQGISLPKLVIVGRRGWGTENMYNIMANDPEVGSSFVFLHNAGDDNLTWLYDHCLFTVLPSFHEGWGIPIAESLARGVPCACSNTSSMVEIGEGIVQHFSPYSTDECLAAIVKWLDPKTLATARKRTAAYEPTSWDASYQQVKKYLEQ